MSIKQSRRHSRLTVIFLAAIILPGCSGYGGGTASSGQQITINSEPQAAAVLANGAEIGHTPLTINPGNHFRAGITSGSSGIIAFQYIGTLAIKKPGCKDYSIQVDDHILSKNIDVKLECDPSYRPAAVQPATTPQPVAQPVTSAPVVAAPATPAATPTPTPAAVAAPAIPEKQVDLTAGDAEERLIRIESLRKKGLLSDEEYRTLRKRVLDTL